MDINNYSYSRMEGKTNIIAECEKGLSGYPVTFELQCTFFGDYLYFVYDLFGDCMEFPFFSLEYDFQKTAYEKAARFYNTLVPEENAIPLF